MRSNWQLKSRGKKLRRLLEKGLNNGTLKKMTGRVVRSRRRLRLKRTRKNGSNHRKKLSKLRGSCKSLMMRKGMRNKKRKLQDMKMDKIMIMIRRSPKNFCAKFVTKSLNQESSLKTISSQKNIKKWLRKL